MLFGRHINRYYLKYSWVLLLGLIALVLVDYFQLEVPELYRMVVNGMNTGSVEVNGELVPFDLDFLLDEICRPFVIIILVMVTGRFAWRVCFSGRASAWRQTSETACSPAARICRNSIIRSTKSEI